MPTRDTIIGIDLGTTNSVVAILEGEQPKVIPNAEGGRLTPSVVSYTGKGDVLIGEAARRQAVMYPQRTVSSIKRFMGRRFREVKQEAELVSYDVVGGRRGFARVRIDGREYSPAEISAAILRKLKEAAEAYAGRPVRRAVITVPAYFNDAQRKATRDAGEIAGLSVEHILNEPTAAALAYGLDQTEGRRIAVVDFGGGTFDVTILQLEDGVFRVLSTSGDTHLGGDDFDKALVNYVADQFQREQGIDLRADRTARQRLLEACEVAKRELSSAQVTDITLPFITADRHGPKHLQMSVQRVELERLIAPLVERACRPIVNALGDAGLETDQIDEIVLVGGTTRVPRVLEMVREVFGKQPRRAENPDEVVAAGAAIRAGMLTGNHDLVLMDVTPLSLGIETVGGFMTKLIERNATIPTRHTEVFSTSEDNQSIVILRVYQGEREIARHNRLLDEFTLQGIRPAPRGVPQIEVTFDIDSDSILHVSAKDLETGQEQTVRISDSAGLSDEEIQQLRQDVGEGDEEEADQHAGMFDQLRRYCESLCSDLESKLSDRTAADVDPQLKEAIRRLIDHSRQLARGESAAQLRAGIGELGRAARDLSEAIRRTSAHKDAPADSPSRGDTDSSDTDPGASSADVIDAEFRVLEPGA